MVGQRKDNDHESAFHHCCGILMEKKKEKEKKRKENQSLHLTEIRVTESINPMS